MPIDSPYAATSYPGMIKGLIFDKDGTLFDFDATWGVWTKGVLQDESAGDPELFDNLARVLGYDPEREGFHPDSIVIAHTTAEIAAAIHPLLPDRSKQDLVARLNDKAAHAPQVQATALLPFLGGLRDRGLCLGIVTNDAEAPARAHLDEVGVSGLFDFIAGYDSGYGGKPEPGGLLAFAQEMDLDPSQCAMVGDSTHDLIAGRSAGMTTIGVLTGLATRVDLTPFADVVLPSIADLPDWLDKQS